MKTFKKLKKGFTLVELVVVIAVIAILAAVSVGAYFGVTESANNSKLEQEAKQVYTAIQTVALAPNDHSSLDKTGLSVSNPGKFELALEESLGREVALTDVQDTKDDTDSTICFFTATQVSGVFGDTKYNSFEYHVPGINGKKAVANVVTGELNISESEAENGEIAPAPIVISLEEANEIGEALANNKYTTQEYILEGQITNIKQDYYGNMYITTNETSFYIYGLLKGETQYGDITDKPELGDYIKVVGTIGNYNGTAQMKSAQLLSSWEGELPTVDPIQISLADANTIGEAATSPTAEIYSVSGTITEVNDIEKGKLTISDGNNTLCIFKPTKIVDGSAVSYANMDVKPGINDVITVTGSLSNYDGVAQIENGVVVEHTDNNVEPITNITDALNAANGYPIVLSGEVTRINENYSSQYDNISITLSDNDGNSIEVYRLKGNVSIHQLITVTGFMGQHKYNAAQRQIFAGATFTGDEIAQCRFNSATCTEPKTCPICGNTEGDPIDHKDLDSDGSCDYCKGNITELNSSKTIKFVPSEEGYENATSVASYVEDTIEILFEKGEGSNEAKYYTSGTALRVYGGNTITISNSVGNILKITFTFGSSDGTNELQSDDSLYQNGEWVGSDNSVVFTIGGTTGNRRIAAIEIIYVSESASGPTEHEHTFDTTGSCTVDGCDVTCTHNWENQSNQSSTCTICKYICNHNLNAGETCENCHYVAPNEQPEDIRVSNIETELSLDFAGTANKVNGGTILSQKYPNWTVTKGTLGQTYADALGFGRTEDPNIQIKSPLLVATNNFTVSALIQGYKSGTADITSTLKFNLLDVNGNVVANGTTIIPGTTKVTSTVTFEYLTGKTYLDVSYLTFEYQKVSGNLSLFTLSAKY